MDKDLALSLYRTMLRIRMVEERIADLYPDQQMRCPVHLCIGQEAIAAGVCANLSKSDYVLSNHRSHGHYLAKGGDLNAMFAELYGKATGCCGGKGGSMHLVDTSVGFLGATPIVASTIPIAAGVAAGSVMRGGSNITVCFFGDAAVEEGVFHESLNFAALKKLPLLFVCENNLYSVNSPLSIRQPPERQICRLAQGHCIEAHQGDGNNVLEVCELARQAVAKAATGRGPVFLEFKTYRWREHCGPYYDHETGIRDKQEFLRWKGRCPIQQLRCELLDQGIATEQTLGRLVGDIDAEIEQAVVFAKKSTFPEPTSLHQHIYA